MSQEDNTDGVEKCGATTAAGTPCQLPADSCPHHGEDSSGRDESPEEIPIPSRNSFEELSQLIIDELGYNPKDSDSEATQACKAWIKSEHSPDDNVEMYISTFGECEEDGCSKGANGYEADYCLSHQQADDEDSSEDNPEGVETKADFVKSLMNDGLTAIEAAEKAEEVWQE